MSADRDRKEGSLSSLPPEIVEKIFLYLDVADIARLSCVCLSWREIANVDHIWYTHIKMLYDFDIQLLVKF